MPTKKITQKQELDNIRDILKGFPNGASIEEIESEVIQLGLKWTRRTLQRKLSLLAEQKKIYMTGQSRATRYYLTSLKDKPQQENHLDHSVIPLSKAGQHILTFVKLPKQKREPVSYSRDFLESYQPNSKNSYLTPAQIKKLTQIGSIKNLIQPVETYSKDILNRLLIDLSWNSSRLEGNTYSLLETQRLLEFSELADDKKATEAQMILNHKEAIRFLVESKKHGNDIGFNKPTILNLHALLSHNLLEPQYSGSLRQKIVGIKGSTYEPLDIPQMIEELFDLILKKARQIQNPYEQAFFIMVHLPYLQPFTDVNKRVSRLATNIPLIKNQLSPLSFLDVPKDIYTQGVLGVYEKRSIFLLRDVFLWAYERSAKQYNVLSHIEHAKPDLFRLKYHKEISLLIHSLISKPLPVKNTLKRIKQESKKFPIREQSQFIEVIESELISLHEGNFARYKVNKQQFENWQKAQKLRKNRIL